MCIHMKQPVQVIAFGQWKVQKHLLLGHPHFCLEIFWIFQIWRIPKERGIKEKTELKAFPLSCCDYKLVHQTLPFLSCSCEASSDDDPQCQQVELWPHTLTDACLTRLLVHTDEAFTTVHPCTTWLSLSRMKVSWCSSRSCKCLTLF